MSPGKTSHDRKPSLSKLSRQLCAINKSLAALCPGGPPAELIHPRPMTRKDNCQQQNAAGCRQLPLTPHSPPWNFSLSNHLCVHPL